MPRLGIQIWVQGDDPGTVAPVATGSPQGERRAGFVGLPLPGVRVKVAAAADAPRGEEPDPSGVQEINTSSGCPLQP